ncbi:MAG TPA: hypothetical protein VN698_16565 [Bacteroidia bacterium]|nr:hypothetical protein [Bacteroidia bacterium]
MNKNYIIIAFFCICFFNSYSQTKAKKDSANADHVLRNASDLVSGNSQDAIVSFFQLAAKDLNTGGSFQFSSSLIAIGAKANNSLLIDTNYSKQNFLRNFNLGLSANLDQSHQFKDAGINIKYAIINRRDTTLFYNAKNYPIGLRKYLEAIPNIVTAVYMNYIPSHRSDSSIIAGYLFHDVDFGDSRLPADFKTFFTDLLKNNSAYRDVPAKKYKDFLKDTTQKNISDFSKRVILTVGGSYNRVNYNTSNKVSGQIEFLKGFVRPKRKMGLELDILGGFNMNDTIVNAVTTNRQIGTGLVGLNWIILKNSANQSILEFKAAVAYKYIANGLLAKEENNVLTGNGTLRFRITNSLWIPIDIKYDPKSGKVFGFLNIVTNFDSFRKLL